MNKILHRYMYRAGLLLSALQLEVDAIEKVPEFQRGWYDEDPTTKKFKLNPAKVEVEDVSALQKTVAATREEVARQKAATARAIAEALKPYEGIDPEETKLLLSQFASDEERRRIAAGQIDQVMMEKTAKQREEWEKQVKTALTERDGAMEVAKTFMARVLDNHIREAATLAGVLPSATQDALRASREIFSLDDEGNPVQYGDDDETVINGKDGKTPYSPSEWLEEMKEKAPHWFPAGATGGNVPGSRKAAILPDLSGLTPQARMTKAREAQAAAQKR